MDQAKAGSPYSVGISIPCQCLGDAVPAQFRRSDSAANRSNQITSTRPALCAHDCSVKSHNWEGDDLGYQLQHHRICVVGSAPSFQEATPPSRGGRLSSAVRWCPWIEHPSRLFHTLPSHVCPNRCFRHASRVEYSAIIIVTVGSMVKIKKYPYELPFRVPPKPCLGHRLVRNSKSKEQKGSKIELFMSDPWNLISSNVEPHLA